MKIHHVGYVVKDIDQFTNNLLVGAITKRVYDDVQRAELGLIETEKIQSNISPWITHPVQQPRWWWDEEHYLL